MQQNYEIPKWAAHSGDSEYYLEVLKNGCILQKIKFDKEKPYLLIGRNIDCDVKLEHTSVSRFHAILQYCDKDSENKYKGYYIYDLGSTHGTIVNKIRLEPKKFYRLFVGYVLKFGESTRLHILNGPYLDTEDTFKIKFQESQNIDEGVEVSWGLSDHQQTPLDLAEETTDQVDEDDFLQDPQKYLKDYLDSQGLELELDIKDDASVRPKKFQCSVILNFDAMQNAGHLMGNQLIEFSSQNKKEAIKTCCQNALRVLNVHGLLKNRNPTKRMTEREVKARRLVMEDFYESDEDEFTDRTGTLEGKRQSRKFRMMKVKDTALRVLDSSVVESSLPTNVHTYESITAKINELETEIQDIDEQINITNDLLRKRKSEFFKEATAASITTTFEAGKSSENKLGKNVENETVATSLIDSQTHDGDFIKTSQSSNTLQQSQQTIDTLDQFMARLEEETEDKPSKLMTKSLFSLNLNARLKKCNAHKEALLCEKARFSKLLAIAQPSPNVKKWLFDKVIPKTEINTLETIKSLSSGDVVGEKAKVLMSDSKSKDVIPLVTDKLEKLQAQNLPNEKKSVELPKNTSTKIYTVAKPPPLPQPPNLAPIQNYIIPADTPAMSMEMNANLKEGDRSVDTSNSPNDTFEPYYSTQQRVKEEPEHHVFAVPTIPASIKGKKRKLLGKHNTATVSPPKAQGGTNTNLSTSNNPAATSETHSKIYGCTTWKPPTFDDSST